MKKYLDTKNYEDRARVGRLINKLQAGLVAALDQALSNYDVSSAQYVVLSTLWNKRADTAAQICREISYTPGAMTRMLDRLEQKKLLVRLPMEDTRRAYKLELTEEGKAVFPDLLVASSAVIDQFFGVYSAEELAQLETLLKKMEGMV